MKLAQLAEMEVKHRCHQILELGFPLGKVAKLFAQDWEGDVTVVMPATLAQVYNTARNFNSFQVKFVIMCKPSTVYSCICYNVGRENLFV